MNGSFIDDARPTSTARTFVARLLARRATGSSNSSGLLLRR